MSTVRIDRVTLNLRGLGQMDGRRLARQFGRDLASADLSAFGAADPLPRVRLDLRAAPGDSIELLSRRLVDSLLGALGDRG